MSKLQQEDLFFDDCPICQTQKRADEQGRAIGLEELLESFEEAKKQGAVVGSGSDLPTIGSGTSGRGGSA